jgi:tetratricopeptide (TPR) repeat protein
MLKPVRFILPAVLLAFSLTACPSWAAEGAGQADLDKASEAKLTAGADLNEVIRLLESALKKGLDAINTDSANRLLTVTLIERAKETAGQISSANFRERRKAAVADLERALKLDPRQPQAYLLLAELNLLPGGAGVKQVAAMLNKAIDSGGEDTDTKAKALVLRAKLEEQPEKKLADLDEAVRLQPDEVSTIRDRGLVLANMDKSERALSDLNRAIELEPNYIPTYEAKAIVLARLKKFDEAIDALNRAWTISKGELDVLLLRAEVYQEKGDKQKALADLDEALKLKPDSRRVILARAMFLAREDRLDEAIAVLEKLAKRDPKDAATLLQLSVLYGAKKNWAKTIEIDRAVLALDPTEWRAVRGLGDAMLNTGRQAEAIAFFEKAIKLEPSDDGILNNLAWVLATSPDAKLRNGRRAIQLATEACKLTEYKLPHVLSTLAAAYAETGDFDNAVKWSTKASEIAEKEKENSKEGDKETREALKKELQNYKAKKPTRELMAEGQSEQKKP